LEKSIALVIVSFCDETLVYRAPKERRMILSVASA